MKPLSWIAFFTALLGLVSISRADDAAALQGIWLATTAELGGIPRPPSAVTNIVLRITDNKWEVTVAGHPDRGTLKIDGAAKPKTMDLTGAEGPNAGRNIPTIYEITGNKLKICYGLKGSPRPTEFKTARGTQQYLVVYQRSQK